jgi:hypothetical protein
MANGMAAQLNPHESADSNCPPPFRSDPCASEHMVMDVTIGIAALLPPHQFRFPISGNSGAAVADSLMRQA